MGESFELSIISEKEIDLKKWQREFSIHSHNYFYKGVFDFFNEKELLLREDKYPLFWVYEISVASKSLFLRDDIVDKILLLLEVVSVIHENSKIEYAIANVETNSLFIDENQDFLTPSKEIILKSALIFIPLSKIEGIEINLYHMVFKFNKMVCFYNPTSGILFSSDDEKFKILKESFR